MEKMGAARAGYDWRQYYQAALLETDRARLPRLIRQAEVALDARIQELHSGQNGSREEREAIAEALAGLNVLRKEVRLVS